MFLEKGGCSIISKEKILLQTINKRGYNRVILSVNGVKETKIVHILVAENFLNHNPKNTNLMVVDHINNIKTDNRLINLQIISHRENTSKDRKNKSSKYVGVCFKKDKNLWQSAIRINGKIKHLGYSKNEKEASFFYQNALKEINNQIN
ncbi:HNH endonuclease [Flavobacterium sp. SUN046]|uniref:HNH endonuclease n=1 Tax=Flavobacterium sp. SUN046 TaxID=3002440 RepID=UPI002DBBC68C|nr:HNH endonuclease [Flavobacterium sp. SUN046]MEC4049772.1 HNH endonuclease [Flavobacterium sp. SUN046]